LSKIRLLKKNKTDNELHDIIKTQRARAVLEPYFVKVARPTG
jgi:hypothetical protein